jgi:hypothetical protein
VQSVESQLTFQRKILPPSSGSKNKLSMKLVALPATFSCWFLALLFFDPEDGGNMFLLISIRSI